MIPHCICEFIKPVVPQPEVRASLRARDIIARGVKRLSAHSVPCYVVRRSTLQYEGAVVGRPTYFGKCYAIRATAI